MIDYNKELVSALNTVLPTHYEMTLTANTKTPCISYMETNNYSITDSQFDSMTLGYSRITYQVKVWANDIATIQKYVVEVDQVLRPLGFKRIATNELADRNSTMIQKILTYECLAHENFN